MNSPPKHLLLRILRQPQAALTLKPAEWDLLLRQARQAGLLARLAAMLDERKLMEQVPPQPRQHLESAHLVAQRLAQAVQWEVSLINKALANTGLPIILLKGAAYVMAKLPPAQGRLFSDIDILVPRERINEVEAALMLHGWASTHHDEYDQRYYRTWMHELPPMQHIKRMTVIDIHHAILPDTAASRPDPAKLMAAAHPIEGYDGLMTLDPVDMVLHSACHLFHESETEHGLRDLADIDALLRHFGNTPAFWPRLVERAWELELARPLFYALRYASQILHTPIPEDAMNAARRGSPGVILTTIMDSLFTRILVSPHASCSDGLSGIARKALYLRGHWLRMPPGLLFRHLFHKTFISAKAE